MKTLAQRDDVAVTDRRWLAVTVLVFLLSLGFLGALYRVYVWTAPHPEVRAALRRLQRFSHWLIPGM